MSDNIVHVTDASFETDVLQSDTPALVDFGQNGVVLAK